MDGYDHSTYGDAFADVYDDWYQRITDVDATVDLLAELARDCAPFPVLELGVGTGRLAIPLAAKGVPVVGLDASAAMLARLADRDPNGSVAVCSGDMVDDQPPGPFALVFVAFNTFFNLLSESRQLACFAAVAQRLAPGAAFVIEAFVPEPHAGSSVEVRSMTVDSVVLSVTTHDDVSPDCAGPLHLVQRVGWSADAAVGNSLCDRRSTRCDGGFVWISSGQSMGRRRGRAVHRRQSTSHQRVSHNSQSRPPRSRRYVLN